MNKRVLLGMSGGVDSSVAAYLLKKRGYEVIGLTMMVIPEDVDHEMCTKNIVKDAKEVAEKLDIEHHIVDFRQVFKTKIIDYFIDEYMKGRTPNPCVACNKKIKFDEFFKKADELNCKYVATGHYAKIVEKDKEYFLYRPEDSKKDQTYFLYGIAKEQLPRILMPLYDITKEEVRTIAEEIGLDIHNKPDSEEICFIPNDDHGSFIESRVKNIQRGNFVDKDGNVLGQHRGLIHYTIGQRKGLGIALGRRVFVKDIIKESNTIVLGDEEDIFKKSLYAEDVNFLNIEKLDKPMRVCAKIRYAMKESPATISSYKNGVKVEFDKEQRAITKGQSVVFYDDGLVVGGGVIKDIL